MEKINNKNIDKIYQSKKPVVIDFYADWCGPCKMMMPVFEQCATSREDVVFVKVNVDENQEIAREFNIRSIPTICIVNNGEVVSSKTGTLSLSVLNKWIDENIN